MGNRASSRQFDDQQYQESFAHTTGREQRIRVHWEPFDVFAERVGNSKKSLTEEQIKQMWDASVGDPHCGAKKVAGLWCLPRFLGLIDDLVDNTMTSSGCSRSVKITDPQEVQSYGEESSKMMKTAQERVEQMFLAETGKLASSHNTLDEDVAEPYAPAITPLFPSTLSRDLKRKMAVEEREEQELMDSIALATAEAVQKESNNPQASPGGEGRKQKRSNTDDLRKVEVRQFCSNKAATARNQYEKQATLVTDSNKLLQELAVPPCAESDDAQEAERDFKAQRTDMFKLLTNALETLKGSLKECTDALTQQANTFCSLEQASEERQIEVQTEAKTVAKKFASSQALKNVTSAIGEAGKFIKLMEKKLTANTSRRSTQASSSEGAAKDKLGMDSLRSTKERLGSDFVKGVSADPAVVVRPVDAMAVLLNPEDAAKKAAKAIQSLEYYKKQSKWLRKHMDTRSLPQAMASIMHAKAADGVADQLRDIKCPDQFEEKVEFVGSEKGWGMEIFTKQFYIVTNNHCSVGCTPYSVGETKMLLDGEEFFLGLPADRCPGSGIAQKIAFLTKASVTDLDGLMQLDGSFRGVLNPGGILAVPAGSILMTVTGESGSEGLRWGFLGDVDADTKSRMERIIAGSQTAYEDLKDHEGLSNWLKYIKFHLRMASA